MTDVENESLTSEASGHEVVASAEIDHAPQGVWLAFLITGGLLILLGLISIAVPLASALAIEVVFGMAMLFGGFAYVAQAVRSRRTEGAIWAYLWAALYLLTGGMLLAYPLSGIITLGLLTAVAFLVEGVSKLVWATQLPAYFNRTFVVIDGVLGCLLGILIWSQWPANSVWVVGVLFGIRLLAGGVLLTSFAFALKRHFA